MAKRVISVLCACIFLFMMETPSSASQLQEEKQYRIFASMVVYSPAFDISDFRDQGILRVGWGCEFIVALAERDGGKGKPAYHKSDSLQADEKVIRNASWDAVLPNGSIVKAHHVDKNGNAFFATPYEMAGNMRVRASLDGAIVDEFDVTIVDKYPDGTLIRGWTYSFTKSYFIKKNGKLARGWMKDGRNWYYLNKDGIMQTGWKYLADNGKKSWYYLSENKSKLGKMCCGWTKVDDTWYYLRKNGTLASNEWCGGYWVSADGSWKYKPKGSWTHSKNGWWFGDTSGWYAKNQKMKINGVLYTFNAEGYLVQ